MSPFRGWSDTFKVTLDDIKKAGHSLNLVSEAIAEMSKQINENLFSPDDPELLRLTALNTSTDQSVEQSMKIHDHPQYHWSFYYQQAPVEELETTLTRRAMTFGEIPR